MTSVTTRTKHELLMYSHNHMAILRWLSANPGEHRISVAKSLAIPMPTGTTLIRELLDEGWLTEGESVRRGGRGRHPVRLFVCSERLVLMGVDLNILDSWVVAMTLDGRVLARTATPLDRNAGRLYGVEQIAQLLLSTRGQYVAQHQRVVGIGIAASRVEASGADGSQGARWSDPRIGEILSERLRGTALQRIPVTSHADFLDARKNIEWPSREITCDNRCADKNIWPFASLTAAPDRAVRAALIAKQRFVCTAAERNNLVV